MPNARKPDTARKPPVPSESHTDIEEWIRRVMPDLHPIVRRLDELICETIPGLQFAIKWKKAYYGVPELGWIIEMVAYDVVQGLSGERAELQEAREDGAGRVGRRARELVSVADRFGLHRARQSA
jgi:hypothetical protein